MPLLAEIIPSEPDADNTDAGNIHTQKQIFLGTTTKMTGNQIINRVGLNPTATGFLISARSRKPVVCSPKPVAGSFQKDFALVCLYQIFSLSVYYTFFYHQKEV